MGRLTVRKHDGRKPAGKKPAAKKLAPKQHAGKKPAAAQAKPAAAGDVADGTGNVPVAQLPADAVAGTAPPPPQPAAAGRVADGKGKGSVAQPPAPVLDKHRAEASEEEESSDEEEEEYSDDDGESAKGLKKKMKRAETRVHSWMKVFYKYQLKLKEQIPSTKLRKLKTLSPHPQRMRQKLTPEERMFNCRKQEERHRELHGGGLGDNYYKFGGACAKFGTAGNW